jgi:hypothetical protein
MTKVDTELILSDGSHCLIDADDYERVASHTWTAGYCRGVCRPVTSISRRTVHLARFILDAHVGTEVDHINHDARDNRKCNLRACTSSENHHNRRKTTQTTSSRFKGVSWYQRARKWQTNIFHDGRLEHIGYFAQEEDAAAAYNARAQELWGEFAHLNGGI